MESKNKKYSNGNKYHIYRYNSTKVKQNTNNLNNINKELNYKKKDEIQTINGNEYKGIRIMNDINNKNLINIILNDNTNSTENKTTNKINPIQEQINKLKAENEYLKSHVDKKGKLINDLKDRCNEQKNMMNELVKKIENIKKFIPEESYRKNKDKEKDKLEEQLAIAAVEEQIIKELCPDSSNQVAMDKIFNGNNNSKESNDVKDKIMNIPQIYYKKNEYENFQCSICFDEFKENELLKQLKCGHIFHKECLSQWFLNQNNCPYCNQI